ncbi:hypothetical protein LINPERHAP2_LOCUS19146 [Linum perenne]
MVADNPSTVTTSASTLPQLSPPSNPQSTLKLTSSIYLLWKTQLNPLLYCHILMKHVNDSSSTPPEKLNVAENQTYISWFSRDQLVLSWITLSLS